MDDFSKNCFLHNRQILLIDSGGSNVPHCLLPSFPAPAFGAVSRIRRLGHGCVWDWNGVELIVTHPFDPGEDVSYRIEEAFVSREKPHALCLR
jgi:hypothetical protein